MFDIAKEIDGYIITRDGLSFRLPRVTKVISYCEAIESNFAFKNWQKRMGGKDNANKYSNEMAKLGTKIHSAIENYNRKNITNFNIEKAKLEGTSVIDFSSNSVIIDSNKAFKMLDKQLQLFSLPHISARTLSTKQKQVWICDDSIQVAGELDEIIDISPNSTSLLNPLTNKYVTGSCLVDLKNTTKQKSRVFLLKYMLQLAAYSLCWENTQKESINQFIVAIATPFSVNYWYCNSSKLSFYKDWFKKAVSSYLKQEKFPWNLFKQEAGIISDNNYDSISTFNMLPVKLLLT